MSREEKIESLDQEVEKILEEARMVLPGLQALFGFQLIAVFNARFDQDLLDSGKRLHLAAVFLTAIAIGLIMAPAAYHRQAERDRISRYFANYASSMIALAMAPLSIALSVEVSLVGFLVTGNITASWVTGGILMIFLTWIWYIFPAYKRRQRATSSRVPGSKSR